MSKLEIDTDGAFVLTVDGQPLGATPTALAPLPRGTPAEVAVAAVAHEAALAYLALVAPQAGGDTPWTALPAVLKADAAAAIRELLDGRIHGVEDLQDAHVAAARARGWTYGAAVSATRKESPLICGFAQLDARAQMALRIYFAVACILADSDLVDVTGNTG